MSEKIFFGRHTERIDSPRTGEVIKEESDKYKGITGSGVERGKERVKDLIDMVDEAPGGAVVFIGGSSEEERTRSTVRLFGDSVADHCKDDPNVLIVSSVEKEGKKFLDYARNVVSENPDKKIVIIRPLFLKEFSLRPKFRDREEGKHTPLSNDLFEEGGDTDEGSTKAFVSRPELAREEAERQIKGINRLRDLIKEIAPGRESITGFVSHGWILDALASYLANQGKAGREGFEAAGGKMIEEAETGKITISGDKAVFTFRGADYEVPLDVLEDK
jgi:broad specificity phosphatase PhoE